jgi:hypothetical protein
VTAKVALILIGMALEVVGLILTASPELAPRWRRLRHFGAERIRRLLRRPRHIVMEAGAGGIVLDGRGFGYVSVPEGAPLERQLAFLREQAEEAQRRLNELEHRAAEMPEQWRKDVETTRAALEARIAQELEQARELFIVQRFIGLTCIATGSVVLAVVNLL